MPTGNGTATRQRKVVCRDCGCIIRMSRAAMLKHGLPTCACSGLMMPEDIGDAVLCGDAGRMDLALHADYCDLVAREARTEHRKARKGAGGAVGQCGGCRKFIPALNTTCTCGFTNRISGRRNDGAYLGLEPDAERRERESIPF